MFASDLESEIPFSETAYSNRTIMEVFYNSLTDDGILVIPLNESPEVWSADETYSECAKRVSVIQLLEDVGFESIHLYEEVSIQGRP